MILERVRRLTRATPAAAELLRAASRFEDVAHSILEKLAEAMFCEWATYWAVDPQAQILRSAATWSCLRTHERRTEAIPLAVIHSASRRKAAVVWRTRKPTWSEDLSLDMERSQAVHAAQTRLRGGLWLAVKTDTTVYGIVELLAVAPPRLTPQTLLMVEQAGFRLGYALEELPSAKTPSFRSP